MLMLLLPKVSKTYHCLCVSRWTRRGKNSPKGTDKGAAAEHLEESLHKGRGKREGKEAVLPIWMSWLFPY